jgi:mRNA-degrading endonuclease RelE of RelBE toxin-antitoxin system
VAEVNCTLAIADEAIAQLRSLPKKQRRRIGDRLTRLQHGLAGDVKKLSGKEDKYRLRELNAAIARNGKKKLVVWDSAKRMLDLED